MTPRPLWPLVAWLPLWLGSCAFVSGCATTGPEWEMQGLSADALGLPDFELHTFDNGLRLVTVENHAHPIVGLTAYVTTGGRTETAPYAGALHFIEHLVFKGGTERFPPTTFRKRIAALGDENGGWTWDDEIQFGFEVPKTNFGEALDIFTESLLELRFSQRWFEDERKVVLQEIEKVGERPWHRLWNAWDALAYQKHPYGRAVIGDAKTIEAQSMEALERYYRERFTPNHLILVVVGDFETSEMVERIRRRYRRYPRGPETFELGIEEPAQTAFRSKRLVYDGTKTTRFILGVRTPGASHADTPGLLLLAELLGSATDGLPAWLQRKAQWVKYLSVDHTFLVDHGTFTIECEVETENAETVLAWLRRYLETLHERRFSPEAIRRAARGLLTERARGWESFGDQAQGLGFWIERMGAEPARKATAAILEQTPDGLSTLAARTFSREKMVQVVLTPDDAALAPARPVADRDPAPALPDLAVPGVLRAADAEPWTWDEPTTHDGVVHYAFGSGLHLLVRRTPGTELMSTVAYVGGGQWTEAASEAGVGELTSRLLTAGTKNLDVAAWDRTLSEHAVVHGTQLGFGNRSHVARNVFARDGATVAFDGTRGQWPLLMALLGEALIRPQFPEAEVNKQRDVLLTEIATLPENNLEFIKQEFYRTAYAGHPYSRPTIGDAATVSTLTAETVRAYHARTYTPDRIVVAVTGDVDPEALATFIAQHWADAPDRRAGPLETRAVPRPDQMPPRKSLSLGRDQWCVNMGFPAVDAASKDAPAMEVLMAIARGRHFYKYVYDKGVSYRSWIKLWPLLRSGPWLLENDVARQGFDETLAEMVADLGRYARGTFGQADLDLARVRIQNQAILGAQKGQQTAFELARGAVLGAGWNAPARRLKLLQGITLEGVRELARKVFGGPYYRVISK